MPENFFFMIYCFGLFSSSQILERLTFVAVSIYVTTSSYTSEKTIVYFLASHVANKRSLSELNVRGQSIVIFLRSGVFIFF